MRSVVLAIFSIVSIILLAQEDHGSKVNIFPSDTNARKNIVSVELGGNGFIYSLNYSRLVCRRWIIRMGFVTLFDATDHSEYGFPFEIYSRSISGKHRFEIGAGLTSALITEKGYKKDFNMFAFLRFGYGYLKPGGRFYYRFGFTPIIDFTSELNNKPFIPFGGISAGYTF